MCVCVCACLDGRDVCLCARACARTCAIEWVGICRLLIVTKVKTETEQRRRDGIMPAEGEGAAFPTVSFFLDDVSGFFRNCVSDSTAPLSRPLSIAQNEALW